MTKIKTLKRGSIVRSDMVGGAPRAALITFPLSLIRFLPGPWRFVPLSVAALGAAGPWLPSHSGIYLGERKIASVDKFGFVRAEHPKEFLPHFKRIHLTTEIQAACIDDQIVSLPWVADYAERMVGKKYDYDLSKNNCHKFVCACIQRDFRGKYKMSGKYSKDKMFLLKDVEMEIQEVHSCRGKIKWRVWDR